MLVPAQKRYGAGESPQYRAFRHAPPTHHCASSNPSHIFCVRLPLPYAASRLLCTRAHQLCVRPRPAALRPKSVTFSVYGFFFCVWVIFDRARSLDRRRGTFDNPGIHTPLRKKAAAWICLSPLPVTSAASHRERQARVCETSLDILDEHTGGRVQ